MTRIVGRCFDPRWVSAIAFVALVGVGLGVVSALRPVNDGVQPLARVAFDAAAALGPNGEPQIVPADPAVEFPAGLSDLPNPPSHLAVDPKSGDVWFLIFTYDGKANTLYHYASTDGKVETFDIPSSSGSELYSAIAVDSRGHVISAEGNVVTDFDPLSSNLKQLSLPAPATKAVVYSPADGPSILDMSLTDGGMAYLSRMNIPAISELDLATGKSREIPYPPEFGPPYDIELAGDGLWMTSRWSVEGTSEAQTGRIGLATGAFVSTGPGMTALAASAGGRPFGIQANTASSGADIGWATEGGLAPLAFDSDAGKALATGGLGLLDYVALGEPGVAWIGSLGSESIFAVDTRLGTVRQYRLPVYEMAFVPRCDVDPGPPGPSPDPCSGARRLKTQVRGLAVAPNGDVYFSDATLNRIGVIHAGR